MEKFKKWCVEFARILHTFHVFLAHEARTPLGHLLIESVVIVFAVYACGLIADRIATIL